MKRQGVVERHSAAERRRFKRNLDGAVNSDGVIERGGAVGRNSVVET